MEEMMGQETVAGHTAERPKEVSPKTAIVKKFIVKQTCPHCQHHKARAYMSKETVVCTKCKHEY